MSLKIWQKVSQFQGCLKLYFGLKLRQKVTPANSTCSNIYELSTLKVSQWYGSVWITRQTEESNLVSLLRSPASFSLNYLPQSIPNELYSLPFTSNYLECPKDCSFGWKPRQTKKSETLATDSNEFHFPFILLREFQSKEQRRRRRLNCFSCQIHNTQSLPTVCDLFNVFLALKTLKLIIKINKLEHK